MMRKPVGWGIAQRPASQFLKEDLVDLVEEVEETFDLMDAYEARLLAGRIRNPSSEYISCVSREDAPVDGTKRLKDGVAEEVVGKAEYERADIADDTARR
jgi:hypothetical protein